MYLDFVFQILLMHLYSYSKYFIKYFAQHWTRCMYCCSTSGSSTPIFSTK